jgi:subtilisin family serine protease
MMDAADRGFDVITMSLGGYGGYGGGRSDGLATYVAAEQRIAQYIEQMGTVVVASAGNGGADLNGWLIHVPGDVPSIINVGATGIQPEPRYPYPGAFDILAFYSNYGAAVTVSGPGGDCGQIGTCDGNRPANWFEYLILSTVVAPDPGCAETASCPVGYGWKAGTSMATPHVSAVAGLIRDENPGMSPKQIRAIIKRTAQKIGSRQDFGHGMVDAAAATQ